MRHHEDDEWFERDRDGQLLGFPYRPDDVASFRIWYSVHDDLPRAVNINPFAFFVFFARHDPDASWYLL